MEDNKEMETAKVTDNGYGIYFCSVCHGSVWQVVDESRYCFRCGALLDWSGVCDN